MQVQRKVSLLLSYQMRLWL